MLSRQYARFSGIWLHWPILLSDPSPVLVSIAFSSRPHFTIKWNSQFLLKRTWRGMFAVFPKIPTNSGDILTWARHLWRLFEEHLCGRETVYCTVLRGPRCRRTLCMIIRNSHSEVLIKYSDRKCSRFIVFRVIVRRRKYFTRFVSRLNRRKAENTGSCWKPTTLNSNRNAT